jgi:methionyl-tRNA formyltransferase
MLVKRSTPIGPCETAGELHDRLAQLGSEAMLETLKRLCAGTLQREKQDDAATCYAPLLKKALGCIDWTRSAQTVHNLVRGLDPWPGAYTLLAGEPLKLACTLPLQEPHAAAPGTVLGTDSQGVRIACGNDVLSVGKLQLPGHRRLPAAEFLRGCALPTGTVLGQ